MLLSLFILPALCVVISSGEEFYEHQAGGGYYDPHQTGSRYEYIADGSSDAWHAGGRLHQSKCEDIPANMTLCRNIGYTKMRLPNLLDHDTITEMLQQARPWVPLLGLGCHKNTKLFLCSLFSPVCVDRPIYPCRTLCEEVKAGCEKRMLNYGYPWPEMLRCDKFPEVNDLCLGPQTWNSPSEDSTCTACNHPETFEAIVDSFCTSDFALRVRIGDQIVSGNDLKLMVKGKKKKYKAEKVSKRDMRNLALYVANGSKCDCPQLTSSGKKDKLLVMGNKMSDDRLVITHLFKYDRQNIDLKRALKAIRKPDTCKKGLGIISIDKEDEKESKNKKDKKGRKKNGNRRSGRENGQPSERREKKNRKNKEPDNDNNNGRRSSEKSRRRMNGRKNGNSAN